MTLNKNATHFLIKLLITTFICLQFGNNAYAAGPVVSFKDMVEKTVTANPDVQLRYHQFLESDYEKDAMLAGFLPKANIVGNYTRQQNLTSVTDGNAEPRYNGYLLLSQMIFDGFATYHEVKRLSHVSRVRYYELQSVMQNITLEFVRAYLDSMRFTELTELAKNNYVVHKQLFDRIQERVTAGVAGKVDLEQAAGRLALAEANLLEMTTNSHDATVRIQRLYGEIPTETLESPAFFNVGVESSVSDALKVAYNQNPDLLSAIESIQSSQDDIKTKQSRYMPRLDLQAHKNLEVSSDGRLNSVAADSVQLTMNFNLFNGFADYNSVNQAAQQLNSSKDMRDRACLDTRQTVNIAYNDIQQLQEQEKYRTQHKNSIENAREAYRKQFDIGRRSLLDLLDTENEYFQAKLSLANTQYDIKMAYARVYAGQGQLLNKIGAARGDLPQYAREDYMNSENICQSLAPAQISIDKAALLADAKPLSATYIIPKVPNNSSKLIEPVKPAEAAVPEAKKILSNKVVPDVQFETNSAKIKPVSYPVLDNALNILREWGDASVEIAGHTDQRNTSKAAYNQKLSEARAQAVLKYLVKKGVALKRLTAKGYGFSQPIAENDPKEGSNINRRVELIRLEK